MRPKTHNVPYKLDYLTEELLCRVARIANKYVKHVALVVGCFSVILSSLFLMQHLSSKQQQEKNSIAGFKGAALKDTSLARVIRLAEAFKATLKDDQLAQLQLTYSKSSAVRWSNFPQAFSRPNRVGLALGTLTSTQLSAFKDLMTSVLSQTSFNEGYDELAGIRAADDLIAKVTGKTDAFGSGNFYIAFLGQPSTMVMLSR